MATKKRKRPANPGLAALSRIRAATAALCKDFEYRASSSPRWVAYAGPAQIVRIARLQGTVKKAFAALDKIMLARRFQAKCGEPVVGKPLWSSG